MSTKCFFIFLFFAENIIKDHGAKLKVFKVKKLYKTIFKEIVYVAEQKTFLLNAKSLFHNSKGLHNSIIFQNTPL